MLKQTHPAPGAGSAAPRATAKQGAIILLGSSLTIMGAVMVAPVLPKIAAEFAPTTPDIATMVPLVVAAPALAIALFAPVAGWLADVAGRKWLLILATLLYALFGFLPSQLHSLEAILLVRLVFGCAEATIMTCCTTLIGDYWDGPERTRYIGRQVVTIGVVGAIFFVIGGAAGEASWRLPFYLYLLPLLLVPFMVRLLWEPTRAKPETQAARSAPAVSGGGNKVLLAASYLLVFVGMVSAFVVPIQSPGLLVAMGITSTTMIGLASGWGLLATLVGSLAWRVARAKLGLARVNFVLLALNAVGLYLLANATSYTMVLIAVAIHGIGAGMLVPNALAPLLERLPERLRARSVGGFTSALYLGQFSSPLIIGVLAGIAKGIPAAIIAFCAVLAVYGVIWLITGGRDKAALQQAQDI
ncbi:MFS transporter [Pseudosulfitobacter sp. DSM 107133]|uniref:MFS transporter n=1 Tax=Pseudosulfitobacter sp. DSM 107133 TaxID=2883100 RepID=UPI000DF21D2D|nr:MFS transporter [Pseudosulfitobacter sp. DSM 107133]UOA29123.1 Bacillibactin exporter [Pseudosulfitobacter sp. DSM 107133]